jgi:hypothetical protein
MHSKIYFKIHESYRRVVAVCDSDLIGKKFEEGIKQLEIKEHFFKGHETEEKEIIELFRRQAVEDATFNIVGEQAVKAAFKAGIIGEGNVGKVDGVPFALVFV